MGETGRQGATPGGLLWSRIGWRPRIISDWTRTGSKRNTVRTQKMCNVSQFPILHFQLVIVNSSLCCCGGCRLCECCESGTGDVGWGKVCQASTAGRAAASLQPGTNHDPSPAASCHHRNSRQEPSNHTQLRTFSRTSGDTFCFAVDVQ